MRTELLTSILRRLNQASPDIQASGVVTKDGLIMAAVLPQGVDEDWLGAMSAAISTLGDRAARELVRGPFEQLLIKGSSGDLMMVHAGPETVLSIVSRADAPLAAIYQDARLAANSIAELVS
jgi:predicted regulator of Ras-like GTPase activity (Roadblock/LC7/MglB family)